MIEAPAFTTTPAHPVRWLVAAVATIAGIFVALWWAGLVNPRVEVEASSEGEGVVTIEVVNHGPLEVRVVGVDWPAEGDARLSLVPEEPVPVPADSVVQVRVTTSAPYCVRSGPPLRLHVRTPVGIDRFVAVPQPYLLTCYD